MAKKVSKKAPVTTAAYTRKGFNVPKGQENNVFLVIEQKQFNPATGERVSKEHSYITGLPQWNRTGTDILRNGYSINSVDHLPKGAIDPRGTSAPKPEKKEL